MKIFKNLPDVKIYFIILNIFLHSIYGEVYNVENLYKESLLINSPSTIRLGSYHGKRVYILSESNNKNDKQKELSQVSPSTINEAIKNTLSYEELPEMVKDDVLISETEVIKENESKLSTTMESLLITEDEEVTNKIYKPELTTLATTKNYFQKKDSSIINKNFDTISKTTTKYSSIDYDSTQYSKFSQKFQPNNDKTLSLINYSSETKNKEEEYQEFLKNNKLIEPLNKYNEDLLTTTSNPTSITNIENLLFSQSTHSKSEIKEFNPTPNKLSKVKWNFGKINVMFEKDNNNEVLVNDKTTISIPVNDVKIINNDANDVKVDKENGSVKGDKDTNFKKTDNIKTFFKFLNVKLEAMSEEVKNETEVINAINEKKNEDKKIINENDTFETVNDTIYDNENLNDINIENVTIESGNEEEEKSDNVEVVLDKDIKNIFSQLFEENNESNESNDALESVTIGEHVTIEEVQYDETESPEGENNYEYDNDFLEENERFDYNVSMLTPFITDLLFRNDETLRVTLVDKMLLEKDIPDIVGDYSGSHIYPILISQNYNNNSLPIIFPDIPVYVMVSLDIIDISSFNMQSMDYVVDILLNMRWYDMRLIHKKNKPISINEQRIIERIWRPDTYVVNAKRSYLHKITFQNIKMRIFPDGLVLYSVHITVQPSCNMRFCMFPHDQQECYLDLSSIAYSDGQLKFIWSEDPYYLINPPTLPEFKLTTITVNECLSHDKLITSSCLRLAFKLKRDSAKYIVEKYIPSTLAMMFAWVAPYVPYNYEDVRIVTPITILLALVQMQKGGIETRTSYLTSLDKWFAVMKVFSVISLMESLVVLSLVRKSRELKKKEFKAVNEFEKEMIKIQERQIKKLYNRIDLIARVISPLVFIFYLIYYVCVMVTGNVDERC
uniref:Neur_chan_LBD domain-containing protein n=1 Tax=Parastrongyloides trichosuri TaxID=131310 RepID=A0A0N4ZBZ9_PARTI